MKIPVNKRKNIHISLFVIAILIQLIIYWIWLNPNNDYSKISESIENASKSSRSILYANQASEEFLVAQNHFNDYVLNRSKKSFDSYEVALFSMSRYLDSLDNMSKLDKNFGNIVNSKKQTEKDIFSIRKELDSLMIKGIKPLNIETNLSDLKLKSYDYKKTLNSIEYDTVTNKDGVKKKGLFKRLGSAISGNADTEKEELQIRIKMLYGKEQKIGSFEEQLKNIFQTIDAYYGNEFKRLTTTYTNLKKKDQELLTINKSILNSSREIISLYSKSAQELNYNQFQNAVKNIKSQRKFIVLLLPLMLLITLFLLGYSLFAYLYENKLLEAKQVAERNLDIKNRIIGMLSHEMRAPLKIISNYSEKLKKSNLKPELIPTVNSLLFTSNSLHITVNQILDFFKNSSSEIKLYQSNFNLKNEIDSVLNSLKSLAEIKHLELNTSIAPSTDIVVFADEVKIHQLFYNIIGNAIKFTDKGTISVTSEIKSLQNKYQLNVTINDTGAGIPQEDLHKIFDKHYQSTIHHEKANLGAGLGLNLCKEIIEKHHGEINVSSELNKGTCISFYLILEPKVAHKKTTKELFEAYNLQKPLQFALLDDDKIALKVLEKTITKSNAISHSFFDVSSFKDFIKTKEIDIIVLDLLIGTYSGETLAKEIRAEKGVNKHKPILIITGDDYFLYKEIDKITYTNVLSKPLNPEEFYLKILEIVT